MKKIVSVILLLCLSACMLVGCRHNITEETKATLEKKVSSALELYADINKLVEANGLEASKEFVDMEKELTNMATKIKGKMAEATEEDGKLATQKVDEIIANLNEVKAKVEKSLEEVK